MVFLEFTLSNPSVQWLKQRTESKVLLEMAISKTIGGIHEASENYSVFLVLEV